MGVDRSLSSDVSTGTHQASTHVVNSIRAFPTLGERNTWAQINDDRSPCPFPPE